MPRKEISLKRISYSNKNHPIRGVVLVGAFFHCTSCGCIVPAEDVGLRQMSNGVVRNQAQCNECRGDD